MPRSRWHSIGGVTMAADGRVCDIPHGTPAYLPPDITPGVVNDFNAFAVDACMLGALAATLLLGRTPSKGSVQQWRDSLLPRPDPDSSHSSMWGAVSGPAIAFLIAALVDRQPVATLLADPWLQRRSGF